MFCGVNEMYAGPYSENGGGESPAGLAGWRAWSVDLTAAKGQGDRTVGSECKRVSVREASKPTMFASPRTLRI